MFKKTTIAALMAGTMFAGNALASEKPGEGVTVRPIMAASVEEIFQHRILFRALQDLGYTVAEPQEVEYQTIHLALGTGDGDFTAVHWNGLH
jgi:glycine betaine/proline transport system substrate-binding protein